MNFTPNDNSQPPQPLLPSSTNTGGDYIYRIDSFSPGSGSTTWSDTDGHQTKYSFDSYGRDVARSTIVGSNTLTQTMVWDSMNMLDSVTDANGHITYYFYDANGNAVEVARPSVPSEGTSFRPTALYNYDAYNNVTAYCDPHFVHSRGLDYNGTSPNGSD
jgi:YD repeat-containing protein